jgi:segregation and condensation protein B
MQVTNYPTFFSLSRVDQKIALETLIFSSEEPLSTKQIVNMLISVEISVPVKIEKDNDIHDLQTSDILNEVSNVSHYDFIENLINEISDDLAASGRPYKIIQIAGGWQFAIMPENGRLINTHFKIKTKKKLTQAALETLAIICYRQPVSKPEIEQIRGVNSNEVVNSLIEKNLIKIAGRSESLGKPLLYATTQEFLRTFGLNSLEDLPKLKELEELNPNKPEEIIENDVILNLKNEFILNVPDSIHDEITHSNEDIIEVID